MIDAPLSRSPTTVMHDKLSFHDNLFTFMHDRYSDDPFTGMHDKYINVLINFPCYS